MNSLLKRGGGQPLSYTNPNTYEPAALPGAPLLYSAGTVARPEIAQKGGQPLSYTTPGVYEPAALAGAPLLYSQGTLARPEIAQKGGFPPSVMSNLVGNAQYLIPIAATSAYRLLNNTQTQTRKRGGGKGNWETMRLRAKANLEDLAPGRANAKWIMKLASTRRKGEDNQAVIRNFRTAKKLGEGAPPKKRVLFRNNGNATLFVNAASKYKFNREEAKRELAAFQAKPTAPQVAKYVSLKREGDQTAIQTFLQQYRSAAALKAQQKKKIEEAKQKIVEEREARTKGKSRTGRAVVAPKIFEPADQAAPKAVQVDEINTRPWGNILKNAGQELRAYGKPKRGNISKFAKYMKQKNTRKMKLFLDEFTRREPESPKVRYRPAVTAAKAPVKREPLVVQPVAQPTTLKPAKVPGQNRTLRLSPGQKDWEKYRNASQKILKAIQPVGATAAEISELAKLIRSEQNIRPFLSQFKSRVESTDARVARLEREREESKWADEEPGMTTFTPPAGLRGTDVFETGDYEPLNRNLGVGVQTNENTNMPETPPLRREVPQFRAPYYSEMPEVAIKRVVPTAAPVEVGLPSGRVIRRYGKQFVQPVAPIRNPPATRRAFENTYEQAKELLKRYEGV